MKSIQAQTAKEVRKELKQHYPNTKFRVTSDSGSMTSSVRIGWVDGPKTEEIDKIVNKYQYGHFDGMIDCYEYSNTKEDIPQVKFVLTQREMSDEAKKLIIEEHNKTFSEECQVKDNDDWNKGMDTWNRTVIYRIFNNKNLEGVF